MTSVFTKIISGEIPATILYEQDNLIVLRDISPRAKTHLLIIPKKEIPTINHITPEDGPLLADLFFVAKKMAEEF